MSEHGEGGAVIRHQSTMDTSKILQYEEGFHNSFRMGEGVEDVWIGNEYYSVHIGVTGKNIVVNVWALVNGNDFIGNDDPLARLEVDEGDRANVVKDLETEEVDTYQTDCPYCGAPWQGPHLPGCQE